MFIRRVLVDAGQNGFPEYIDNLTTLLESEGCQVSDVIITHWHPDHIGGVPDILRKLKYEPRIHKFPRVDAPEPDIGKVKVCALSDGQVFDVDGGSVQVVHTPGHTTDHVVLHLKNDDVLLSADCILGEGTAQFEDLHSYMTSLHKILELSPKFIYPGHGPIVEDPVMKIEYYIKHRMQREGQILDTLRNNRGLMTARELVEIIYKETPKHLYPAAEVNVNQHLVKLVKDGKVEKVEGKWRAIL